MTVIPLARWTTSVTLRAASASAGQTPTAVSVTNASLASGASLIARGASATATRTSAIRGLAPALAAGIQQKDTIVTGKKAVFIQG